MPQINHPKKTPGELAIEANTQANINLNLDSETYSSEVVRILRDEDNISLSNELATLRKALKKCLDKAKINDPDFEAYNTAAEAAKEKAKPVETED